MSQSERDPTHAASLDVDQPPGLHRQAGGNKAVREEIVGVSAVRVTRDVVAESCGRCAETGRTCASCVQRRRYAWSLVTEQGEPFEATGRILGLASYRVRELVAAEHDRRELNSLRCNSIPVQRTQAVITEALARDPELTIGEIAHWLDMRQGDFERAFLGKGREGRPKQRVNVANASRLMIALGRAPNELEGC
jgi:hypothetical protein